MVHELLSGTYDLHIHTAPDVIPRKCTDEETVRRLEAVGMKGCAIKCHYFETAARAALLQDRFPQMKIVGGLVLNRSVGGYQSGSRGAVRADGRQNALVSHYGRPFVSTV